jgi:hypothetical protein
VRAVLPRPSGRTEGQRTGTEVGLFRAGVSGGDVHGVYASPFQRPDLLTRGAFRPEASIVAVVICFATDVFVLWRARSVRRAVLEASGALERKDAPQRLARGLEREVPSHVVEPTCR